MLKRFAIIILVFTIGLCSCAEQDTATKPLYENTIYSQDLKISREKGYTLVDIANPWKEGEILQRYILIDREKKAPKNLPQGTIIKTPIKNIIVYASIHASIIDELGEVDKIIGVCESQYITSQPILKGLKEGKIADLGQASNPNTEKIIDINGEVIIASPFENASHGSVEKLCIPIIEAADYMENSPLGRTEWIKLYGLLLDKEEKADSIFNATVYNYNQLKSLAENTKTKPTLLAEKKFGNTWYISGADSYMGNMYKDAGVKYIFQDLPGSKSVPMSFESVLDKAIDSDLWLIKYNSNINLTYKELKSEFKPYSQFKAYKKRNIIGCNTANNSYYDDITLHPDYILKDLIKAFHPELLPEYKTRYFHHLQ